MGRVMRAVLLFCVLCGTASASGDIFHPERGIGHAILEIESRAGALPSDERILERVILSVVMKLKQEGLAPKERYSIGDAPEIFLAIQRHLRDGVKLKIAKTNDAQLYFLRALRDNYWDCDTLSFLYIAIGESLKLPIHAVVAPGHVFVRWEGVGWQYNWDPRSGGSYSDRHYLVTNDIAKESVERGFFLTSLSRTETMGIVFFNLSYGIVDKGTKEECTRALPELVRAIALWPKNAYAYDLRSWCWLIQEEPKKALEDADCALELEPLYTLAHRRKAKAVIALGRGEQEAAFLTGIIEKNDNAAGAYYLRGYIRFLLDRPGVHESERREFYHLSGQDLNMACDRTNRFCMPESRYFR